uniref:Uncharacterized protein n=1 Tax=Helianthus annuus TaxID=4232 RepID=A0A1Y3BYJ2_HELAN
MGHNINACINDANVTLKQASLCHHRSRLQLTWLLASSRDFTHRHACVNMPMGPCRNYLGR